MAHIPQVKTVIYVLLMALVLVPFARGEAPQDSSTTVDMSQYRGQVVYLDFWASWCAPCLKSFPWMIELQTRFGGDGLEVVAVNLDRDRSAADKFLEKTSPDFRIIFDPEGKLAKEYELEALPMSFLFDRQGKLRHRQMGFSKKDSKLMEQTIVELLAEPAEALEQEDTAP